MKTSWWACVLLGHFQHCFFLFEVWNSTCKNGKPSGIKVTCGLCPLWIRGRLKCHFLLPVTSFCNCGTVYFSHGHDVQWKKYGSKSNWEPEESEIARTVHLWNSRFTLPWRRILLLDERKAWNYSRLLALLHCRQNNVSKESVYVNWLWCVNWMLWLTVQCTTKLHD